MTPRLTDPSLWRPTAEKCPHCGYQGLLAMYKQRRLLAETCPDCGKVWHYFVKPLPVRC